MDERYARQITMPGIGAAGQERLAAARVVVAGAGGLGFPVLTYLGAAGVGTVVVVDRDRVERSNLNRQCLFSEFDLGRPKADAAVERLTELNAAVHWRPVAEPLSAALADRLVAGCDLTLDCLDNRAARLVLAGAAHRAGVPVVHGAVAGFEGTVGVLDSRAGACLGCLLGQESGDGAAPPVLGAVVGVVGSLMATFAIRRLCGNRVEPGRVLLVDLQRDSFDWVRVGKQADCPTCSGG